MTSNQIPLGERNDSIDSECQNLERKDNWTMDEFDCNTDDFNNNGFQVRKSAKHYGQELEVFSGLFYIDTTPQREEENEKAERPKCERV